MAQHGYGRPKTSSIDAHDFMADRLLGSGVLTRPQLTRLRDVGRTKRFQGCKQLWSFEAAGGFPKRTMVRGSLLKRPWSVSCHILAFACLKPMPMMLTPKAITCISIAMTRIKSGWWFQIFCMFTPIWGNDPFWPLFFDWLETTN